MFIASIGGYSWLLYVDAVFCDLVQLIICRKCCLGVERAMAPHSSTLAWKIPWTEEPGGLQSMGSLGSDTTERLHFHFHALEKEMATHSSVLAWRIPGTGEPGGLLSMGSHRVGHDWSDSSSSSSRPCFMKYRGWWIKKEISIIYDINCMPC